MIDSWKTHKVTNQFDELTDYNLFSTDTVMNEYLKQHHLEEYISELQKTGEVLGTKESFEKGIRCNLYPPSLKAFDRRGNRIDQVEFHPDWHHFMSEAKKTGLISYAYENNKKGRWAFAAINFILQSQVEPGALCPATMTQASIPLIQKEEKLWEQLRDKLLSREYDERDLPISEKKSIWIGMGMTEKQGGSDVRSNTTVAKRVNTLNSGFNEFLLTGHKWFFSAPMCDAHLVVARIEDNDQLACFYVPRWKPNNEKNPIEIQRLKEKVGNNSNSSSEVEFRDAWGILIGEEGRGIPTIIEMATFTRLNCILGATAIIRQATTQAYSYALNRMVFGKKLIDQPLMRSVLAELALENESATLTSLFLADCFENSETSEVSKAFRRTITPAAKYWICKKSIEVSAEAMEVFGGNGYVNDGIMARLFKEAPVNSIWEGSGNVMCLDVLRSIKKDPNDLRLVFKYLKELVINNNKLVQHIDNLEQWLQDNLDANFEAKARLFTEQLILTIQACLMYKYSPKSVFEAFFNSRLNNSKQGHFIGSNTFDIETTEAILSRIIHS